MRKKFSSIIFMVLAMTATSCNLSLAPQPAQDSAYIGGAITADLNGNGTMDDGEAPLDNVIVSLSGCGEDRTALSGSDGSFRFGGLPTGVCILEVTKGGWSYSASYPTPGYPIPVTADTSQPAALVIFMRPADQTQAIPVTGDPTVTQPPTSLPLTATLEATVTPEATATSSDPMVSAIDKGVNCRVGPGIGYEATDVLLAGQMVPIIGKTEDASWWQVNGPNYGSGKCFVADSATKISGDLSGVPIVEAPIPDGIPVILSVELTEDRTSGNLIIYQDVYFKDSEGDINYAEAKLVSTTATHEFNIQSGSVNVPSAEQKAGASIPGKWNCGGENYVVTLSVTLLDKAGHRSEPYIFTMVCD